jgi:hypothetical protein
VHPRTISVALLLAAAAPFALLGQPVVFRNVAAASGLDFVVENHPTPRKHLIETMPGGVAVFDYNGDGLADIYFTNGAAVPSLAKDSPEYWNRLYRNEGGMKFKDVTSEAGTAGEGYSIGAAAADYDNDGDVDLFVAGVRRNLLYQNQGDGTFQQVAKQAGIGSERWSVGAAWFDYDNDGLLDLFVVNYVEWTPAFDEFCGSRPGNVRAYCHPRLFEGSANTLYRNRGDGTFEDVSQATGIAAHIGKGMGAAVADYDLDGFPDIFVTNDKLASFLFHNLAGFKFEEVALLAGGALRDNGMAVSGMGVDFRDYDNDSLPDIFFTALSNETFPLFQNQGNGSFREAGVSSRMGPLTRKLSGWSAGLFDFNNDGWKDIFTANAHVSDVIEFFEAAVYKQSNSVFLNQGDGSFRDVSAEAGLAGTAPAAHRGGAFADFNNDGRIDVVVASLGGPAELWENTSEARNTWLTLKLVGTRSNRDGIGARVRIGTQYNQMTSAVGYASSSHDGVHFGTGKARTVDEIEIIWPSGRKQALRNVSTNRILDVREESEPQASPSGLR